MKHAFKNADGTVGVIHLIDGGDANEFLPDGAMMIGPVESLPSRYFRDTWKHDGVSGVEVTLPDARSEKLKKIRAERDQYFTSLDKEYSEMLGKRKAFNHPDVDAVEDKRQQLRDLPQSVSGTLEMFSDLEVIANYDAFQSVSGIL